MQDTPAPRGAGVLSERAYLDLRDRIVTLELAPGTLLREDELMVELGIGRTPLREAVRRLALEDLVVVQPRVGTRVTGVDVPSVIAVCEVRAEIEGFAAYLAAERCDDDARGVAAAMLVEFSSPPADFEALMDLDARAHRWVWTTAGNDYLLATLERYFALSTRIWHVVRRAEPGVGHAADELGPILESIVAGDGAGARERVAAHVLGFQGEILGALK